MGANYRLLKWTEASGDVVELTAEGVSSESFSIPNFGVPGRVTVPITVAVAGDIAAAETITFSYWDGTQWLDFKMQGDQLTLDEDNMIQAIYSNLTLRATKTVTTDPVGVIVYW